jgi:hypothetical protein
VFAAVSVLAAACSDGPASSRTSASAASSTSVATSSANPSDPDQSEQEDAIRAALMRSKYRSSVANVEYNSGWVTITLNVNTSEDDVEVMKGRCDAADVYLVYVREIRIEPQFRVGGITC